MKAPRLMKWLFYLNLTIVGFLIGYKLYLNLDRPEYNSLHTEQLRLLKDNLESRDDYQFAVVGNINNSVGVFEKRITPTLNQSGVNFMVSAGNAVSGGGEDKYRALHGTLSHLDIPYLLTFGEQEHEDFGSFRFYEHFGPYFYNFKLGNSQFIFLDSTGKTPWRWQIEWLKGLLGDAQSGPVFLFLGHPLYPVEHELLFERGDQYLQDPTFKDALLGLIHQHDVTAVFSANLPLYSRQTHQDTHFITTGGGGGLVLNDDVSFYHYVKVAVSGRDVDITMERLDVGQHPLLSTLESLWFFIYSLFYVGYVNFILLVSAFTVIAIKLYQRIVVGQDYYPDFDLDPTPWQKAPLRVAMFTNNYLPFIGGVPLSIERLRRGLTALGNSVLVVAPRYRRQDPEESGVVRAHSLLTLGVRGEFRLPNIFLKRIRRAVREFKPDLIHVHHPIWMGSLGLWLARRLDIPSVYTYHTRLEHYAHFVPLPGALFRNLISHGLIKRFANRCSGVIVPTNSAEDYLRMIGVKTPIFVQPTGIDYDRFQTVDDAALARLRQQYTLEGKRVLISVSRLSTEKNIDFLLDAVARLKDQTRTPFHLLMIGDGHERHRLQQRIEQEALADHITLVGAIAPEDMATYYRLGDLFVFASKSETQGMVILEAMAASLPVVAVRSSGIDDVVREDENGYKTPDNLEVWCQRARQLIEDDMHRDRLSRQAQSFAQQYSTDAFARNVKGIYSWLMAAHHQHKNHSEW
ncbi:glycosyltransferase [Marinimicrobium sp. UBA4209]|jgi:glycosyltransferase involved in cell wall biosynthesis|uniref:glycosyltransferase n=3 Tax=unclassified Marinimicrobium TaxID=2632100 RepID=UPI00257D7B0F|nr:glycosyltransferase [Marinimicrobium sp. UBA4209]